MDWECYCIAVDGCVSYQKLHYSRGETVFAALLLSLNTKQMSRVAADRRKPKVVWTDC